MGNQEKTVKIGWVGLGPRGYGLLGTLLDVAGVQVTALCDLQADLLEQAHERVDQRQDASPFCTLDMDEMLVREDVDAVIIATDWASHIPLAIRAMRAGKPTAVEVGGAYSLQQCWDLVAAYRQTGIHCMMLENCCYGRDEMALLQMARNNVMGEIVHCQGSYGHDLRPFLMDRLQKRSYRTRNYMHRNCDNYPTHELGPLAKILGINRGNRMTSLSSVATKARGYNVLVTEKAGENHPLARYPMAQGDIVMTTIRCAGGEIMMLTLDTSLPRPYSRGILVQGTRGLWQEDGRLFYIEGRSPHEQWEDFDACREEFDHPLWKEFLSGGVHGGHGGMDFLVLSAFVDSVSRRVPPPIDTFDTASWMAVSALSEDSIALGGQNVAFPDFTDGQWLMREAALPGRYTLDA